MTGLPIAIHTGHMRDVLIGPGGLGFAVGPVLFLDRLRALRIRLPSTFQRFFRLFLRRLRYVLIEAC